MAIYRKCKYCGQRISLRMMPAGHWVAFDWGTDNVHGCVQVSTSRRRLLSTITFKPVRAPVGALVTSAKGNITVVAPSPMAATSRKRIRALVEKALREHRCLRLTYYTASRKAVTDRVVEPLALEPGDYGGTLLRAYCRWRQDFRSFAISNIRRAELLDERFTPRPLPSRPRTAYRTPIHGSNPAASQSKPVASDYVGCVLWLIIGGIVILSLLLGKW